MPSSAVAVPEGLVGTVRLGAPQTLPFQPARWCFQELRGRLIEISGAGNSAVLTLAFTILLDAQRQQEPVAWITRRDSCFYPPDAHATGVDLGAVAVVRLSRQHEILRAAEYLARSGGFGLLVCDLSAGTDKSTALGRAPGPVVPMAMQARLRSLAHRHDLAVLCLTRKPHGKSSLGSLVSLHAEAHRKHGSNGFVCRLRIVKDKQYGRPWEHAEWVRGPDGLV